MSAWATPAVRQQIHVDALRKLGRRAKVRCRRCKGSRQIPGWLVKAKRCPNCDGTGETDSPAAARLERRMLKSWDRKQRVANARPRQKMGADRGQR
jgi:hypothetical protein